MFRLSRLTIIFFILAQSFFLSSVFSADLSTFKQLKQCAQDLAVTVEMNSLEEHWTSKKSEDPFLFLTCDRFQKPNLHTFFKNGFIYQLNIPEHRDFPGFEVIYATVRFRLNQKNYIYEGNLIGEMGSIYDEQGVNLTGGEVEKRRIDPTDKNKIIEFYMKQVLKPYRFGGVLEVQALPESEYDQTQPCLLKLIKGYLEDQRRGYLGLARQAMSRLDSARTVSELPTLVELEKIKNLYTSARCQISRFFTYLS
jgi:hypothetical protein